MKTYNVAVVGATGAVGQEMVSILEQRDFPVNRLKLLATERSAGTEMEFKGETHVVKTIDSDTFRDIDIALFSIGSTPSKEIVPRAVEAGAIAIDNSNAFRMDESVPLVVPEINAESIIGHKGIIANPNCSTIQMVLPLKAIYDHAGIKRVIVSTYQAVSGTGRAAIRELTEQSRDFLEQKELKKEVYPHQIAFNALPHIDVFYENGYTKEELKLVRETRKILGDDQLAISATAVRIPVFYGHSESINVEMEKDLDISKLREILQNREGIRVIDQPDQNQYPLATMSETEDRVMVGRIRRDPSRERSVNMWVVANNLRKGAALNAVQIAENLS